MPQIWRRLEMDRRPSRLRHFRKSFNEFCDCDLTWTYAGKLDAINTLIIMKPVTNYSNLSPVERQFTTAAVPIPNIGEDRRLTSWRSLKHYSEVNNFEINDWICQRKEGLTTRLRERMTNQSVINMHDANKDGVYGNPAIMREEGRRHAAAAVASLSDTWHNLVSRNC